MSSRTSGIGSGVAAILLLSVAGLFLSGMSATAEQRRSMTRQEDFLVIHGKQLKNSLKKEISKLALLAKKDGQLQPVPFQVDEIDKEGEWVLPELPPYLEDPKIKVEHDEDNGRVDKNDELVFMVRDAGDRIDPRGYPRDAESGDEIMLIDPVDGGRAWVYLCCFPEAPPLSQRDYVSYVFPENHVVTSAFDLGFSMRVPISWEHLSFLNQANMIDRMKIRMTMKIGGIPFSRDETHFQSKLSLFKDGPVRVIRRVRSSITLKGPLRTPSAASESIYYDNAIVIPFRIAIPINMKRFNWFVKDILVRGGVDCQNMHGWRLRTDVDPNWLKIDGKMDLVEKNIKGEGATWFVLKGPPGAFLCRMILDRKPDGSHQDLPISSTFFYMDDDATPDPPEFIPGQSPNLGFWMKGMENLPKGVFYFYLISYMIKDYHEGIEPEFLRIMDQPIQVEVNPG